MSEPRRVLLSWSSGKDSAWTLHVLRRDPAFEVVGLLTVVDDDAGHVPMHKTPLGLLRLQATSVGLPLHELALTSPGPTSYEDRMRAMLERARAEGVTAVAFGDLFLDDLRAAREEKMHGTGIDAVFPLWRRDTTALAAEMVAAGLRARLTYVDTGKLPLAFLGRVFDETLLRDLPAEVDPCGENGEFHSFAFDGPMFAKPIEVEAAEVVGQHLILRPPTRAPLTGPAPIA